MATYIEAPEDQLSEEGTMSFLDHLDELRKRLVRMAIFIAVAFVVSWIFSDKIYNFLEVPVRAAMMEAKRQSTPKINAPKLMLADKADGTKLIFAFPTEAKVNGNLIQAGATITAREI